MVYIVPVLIILILISALKKGVPCYSSFIQGAENGLKTVISLLPPLIAILSAAAMLRASGAIDAISRFLSPFLRSLNFPEEILPLALIRPISGSGALGLLTDTLKTFGVHSRASLAACILCASTETTFYTLSVYFAPTGVKYTKRVIFAALFGDFVGILCASLLSTINF